MAWGLGALFSGFGKKGRKRGRDEGGAEQRDAGEQRSGRKNDGAAVTAATGKPDKGGGGSGAGRQRRASTNKKVTFKAEGPATRARKEQAEPEAPPSSKQRARQDKLPTQDKRSEPASKKQRQQEQVQQRASQRKQGAAAQRQQEKEAPPKAQRGQQQLAEQAGPSRRGRKLKQAAHGVAPAGAEASTQAQPSNRQPEATVDPPAPSGNEPPKTTGGGMKRVRSSWKMRPLFIDEKLRVFVEGRDDDIQHYDGGEFYQWLKDCEAGGSKAEDTFCYPLIVQDQDMRTVFAIKQPAESGKQQQVDAIGHVAKEGPITVPTIKELPREEQPDAMLGEAPPSASAQAPREATEAAAAEHDEEEAAGDLDPPYVRYLDPTPDEMDLAVEYDLDEEDEEWLEAFNERARKGKSRKARIKLSEDWLERLMDRMEKEYTHALQRNPEKWVVHQPAAGSSTDVPSVTLPPIEEVFPLVDCMMAPGMHHYPNIIEAVYGYWKGKHSRAGMPLIQRLWYEPPWHRKKAAERLAEEDGGEGPFLAHDAPVALQNVRRRKLDTEEIRVRFSELRRDLDAARLLADQVRKREKLKKQELRLFQEEWAARMAEIERGKPILLRNGQLRNPPPTLSAVARLGAASAAASAAAAGPLGEQEGADAAEDRAARLAARRSARDAATVGPTKRSHKAGQVQAAARKPPPPRKQRQQQQLDEEDEEGEDVSAAEVGEPAEDTANATTSRRQPKQKQKRATAARVAGQPRQQPREDVQQAGQEGVMQSKRGRGRPRKRPLPEPEQLEPAGPSSEHAFNSGLLNTGQPKLGRGRPANRRQQEPEQEPAGPSGEHASDSEVENSPPPSRPKRARLEAATPVALRRHQQQQVVQAEPAAAPALPQPSRASTGRFLRSPRPLKEVNGGSEAPATTGGGAKGGAAAAAAAVASGSAGRKGRQAGGSASKAAAALKRPLVAGPRISREVLSLF